MIFLYLKSVFLKFSITSNLFNNSNSFLILAYFNLSFSNFCKFYLSIYSNEYLSLGSLILKYCFRFLESDDNDNFDNMSLFFSSFGERNRF